jgi:hypothetical protein
MVVVPKGIMRFQIMDGFHKDKEKTAHRGAESWRLQAAS